MTIIGTSADGLAQGGEAAGVPLAHRHDVAVEEAPDGATVRGGRFSGGSVDSCHDHRVAMSLAMAATIADGDVVIQDVDNVNTSFPGFCECVAGLGANVELV